MRGFDLKKIFLCMVLLITLLSACNTSSTVQKEQDPLADKVDKLFSALNETDSPGIAVLVVRGGKVLLRRGYGMANLEHRIPITPKSVFDIASVSKQFTGMAISMLIEQGKVSLKDDVHKYIPELPDFSQTITIDHLVHHTSGIRDWPGTLALAGWRMDDIISFDQILTMAFNQQDLNFKPGEEYSYSNTGYNLLAEVVKRVSGMSFRKWTETNIFQPLGMKNTHFHDNHTEVVKNKVYGYSKDRDGKFRAVPNGLTALGSSSLYTTIDDLSKWVMNFENPQVGGSAVIERMLKQGVLNSGKEIAYAFGINIGQYRGLRTISHGGSWASFLTFLVHFPDQNFSVVVLLNYPSSAGQAAYKVVDIYLSDKLNPLPKKDTREKLDPETVKVPISVMDEYVGTYRLGAGWYVTITRKGNHLMAYATDEENVPLTAQSETRFWVKAYNAPIIFKRNENGQVTHFLYRGMTCPKMEDVSPSSMNELRKLTGEYVSEELKTSYRIILEDGKLVAKHRRLGTISLTHAWKDDFRSGEWFMRSVEFYRDKAGQAVGFLVTQDRSRFQRFIKQK